MPRFDRRSLLSTALLLAAGCGNDTPPGGASPSPASGASPTTTTSPASDAGSPAATGKKIKAGLVTDIGGVDDKSFNAAAWLGLQEAAKALGTDIKLTESRTNADYGSNLGRFAQNGYELVFAVGVLMQDAFKEAAARYPNVKFAIIDGDAPDLPNCIAYKFREEEGSFLVGALAGLMTKSKVVGFVGGMELPLIKKFEVGYTAGVKTTNPAAEVKVGYAGKFNDPAKGQELALSQMGAKADILYHAAGSTGLGVIKAVEGKGAGFYAIGVDQDQDGVAPGRVLVSMVKRVDKAVFDVCKAVADGTFKPGTLVQGVKEDRIGLSEMKYTKKDIPAEALAKVESLRQMIIAGKLVPPTTPEELAKFTAPEV